MLDKFKAGQVFDIVTIQNRNSKAKTNFSYGVFELLAIMFEKNLA